MNSLIRIATVVNKVNCANPADCLEEIKQHISELTACDIILLPKLALCSPAGSSLLMNPFLPEQCGEALDGLALATRELPGYVICGLAQDDAGRTASLMAVLYRGSLIALVPTENNPPPFINGGYSEMVVPPSTVFDCGGLRFCVCGCGFSALASGCVAAAQTGCDLILVPAYEPIWAGRIVEVCRQVKTLSQSLGCAVAVVNGGVGDTSSPFVYQGFAAVYECGNRLLRQSAGYEGFSAVADLDCDIIRSQKKSLAYVRPSHAIQPESGKRGLFREIIKNPYLPPKNEAAYLSQLFRLQVRSLVARLENTGMARLIAGVSGGLDSTAALLVAAKAMDILGLPRGNVIGVTMPGFGTSDRTYFNALSIIEQLGLEQRDIPIRASVLQHLEDIGHTGQKDVTYENAQARERAQILLDLGNSAGALVVGSSDLSEEALGFCTFAGDHIAGYNVNCCIPKTVLRALVRHIADEDMFPGVSEVLRDILDTPVSPELLPPDETGEIAQKTEEILGPYELHDFFIYYFIKYRFRPSKLYYYACMAFADTFEPGFIKDKLGIFLRRFTAGQFKRSCAPDAASITDVNLLGVNFAIPSDLDPSSLLKELARIDG